MSNDLLLEPWPAQHEKPLATNAVDQAVARLSPTRIVNQLVSKMNEPPNKFAELALRSAAIRKDLDVRADKLATRLDAIPALADATLGKHERMLDETESGIQALEDSLRDMAGHNSK